MGNDLVIKGFPTQVGAHIELPTIAELLLYPNFFDTHIEEVYTHGTEFQKWLINQVPLQGNKKHVTVLWQMRYLHGSIRSCTGFSEEAAKDARNEWHIDSEEEGQAGGQMRRYWEETDIVHLFTNETTGMTEFNENEIIVPDWDGFDKDANYFFNYIRNHGEEIGIKPKTMPANRFVTFRNHLHRATPVTRPEFRFMLRVVETDRQRPPSSPFYNPESASTIVNQQNQQVVNIEQKRNEIIIHMPEAISQSDWYIPEVKEYTKMVISKAFWEATGVAEDNQELIDFTPKNTIMLLNFRDFLNQDWMYEHLTRFQENFDRKAWLVNYEYGIRLQCELLDKKFLNRDSKLGLMSGAYISLTDDQVEIVKKFKTFDIEFDEELSKYSFSNCLGVKFTYPE